MASSPNLLSANSSRQTTSAWKRFRFPLIVLILGGILFALPWVWSTLDDDVPIPVGMLIYWAPLLALLLITLWWLFFSGYRWYTRLGITLLIVMGVVSFIYFGVRKVEMGMTTMALLPRFHFTWETSAEEKMDRYLEEHPVKDADLSAIDATASPEDFPRYRGSNADGVISLARLNTDWQHAPPQDPLEASMPRWL